MITCSTCKKEYKISGDTYTGEDWEWNYCSKQCFMTSEIMNNMLDNCIGFLKSLNNDQLIYLSQLIKNEYSIDILSTSIKSVMSCISINK